MSSHSLHNSDETLDHDNGSRSSQPWPHKSDESLDHDNRNIRLSTQSRHNSDDSLNHDTVDLVVSDYDSRFDTVPFAVNTQTGDSDSAANISMIIGNGTGDGRLLDQDPRDKMKKNITVIRGVCIVLCTIIGTGIFVAPNSITKSLNAPATSILVWVAGGFIAIFGGLTLAELAGMFPKSGCEVTYIRRIYGRLPSFLSVFLTYFILVGLRRSVGVLTFAKYFWNIFFEQPEDVIPGYCNGLLGAVAIALVITLTIVKPTLAVKTIVLWTVLKVLALVMIIVLGAVELGKGNTGHIDDGFNGTETNPMKWVGAWSGVVWAYFGWDAVCAVTSEVQNPQRNIPIIISVSVAIVTVLYTLTVTSFHIILPHDTIINPDINVASEFGTRALGDWGRVILSIGVAISAFGNLSVSILTQSRFIHSGAVEGVLPEVFALVHKRFRTPVVALIFLGVTACISVFFGNLENLIGAATFTTFPFYVLCAVGVFVMRRTHPDIHRPYKVPLLFPALFIVFGVYMFVLPFLSKAWLESIIYVLVLLAGIPIYFVCVKDVFNLERLRSCMTSLKCGVARLLNCE